jgi:chromosome segregation ATPase
VKEVFPDVRLELEKTADSIMKILEKISKKEVVINKSFSHMTGDYRAHSDDLKEVTESHTDLSTNVEKLQQRLMEITEKLDEIQVTLNT